MKLMISFLRILFCFFCFLFSVVLFAVPATPGKPEVLPGSYNDVMMVGWPGVAGAVKYNLLMGVNGSWEGIATEVWGAGITVTGKHGNTYEFMVSACDNRGECSFFSARSAPYLLLTHAEMPIITPAGGTFERSVSVSISNPTSGAVVRYTTNNTTVTSSSPLYSGAFTLTNNATVRAKAFKSGLNDSLESYAQFTVLQPVATPTISPSGGSHTNSVSVTLASSTSGATLRYTTNNTAVTASSPVYSSPFTLAASSTVRARAFKSGMADSAEHSASFTIVPQVAMPTVSPDSGTYSGYIAVTLSTATSGAILRYSTNNTAVTASSAVYTGPIALTQSATVRARAFKGGMADSAERSVSFTIVIPAVPVAPQITGIGQGMTVGWTAVPGAVKYNVVQLKNDGVGEFREVWDNTATTFSGEEGATYRYQVSSCDNRGECSAYSAYSQPYTVPYNAVAPVISPNGGTHTGQATVTLSTSTADTVIRYTTNGSVVQTNSTLYTSPFVMAQSGVIRARAFKSGGGSSPESQAAFTIKTSPPTISPNGGGHVGSVSVTLTSATSGATLRYTTNNTAVTASSPVYNGPVTLTANTTVRTRAFKTGQADSDERTAQFNIQVLPVDITPDAGSHIGNITVSLSSATPGATIRYTTNNTAVTTSSAVYSEPLTLTNNTTVRARAFKEGMTDSAERSEQFSVRVASPSITPNGGNHSGEVYVGLNSSVESAVLRYSIDNTPVTVNSLLYTDNIHLTESTTVRAKAFKTGMTESAEVQAHFVISSGPATWADKTSVVPEDFAVSEDSYTALAHTLVGSIKAKGGVNGGQASYELPVLLPPGRAGMQPEVSLSYRSRSGNGIAGMGWHLQTGSAISRCSATVAQDGWFAGVTYSLADKLCYNGQRLMLSEGTYGYAGAVYQTETDRLIRVTQSGGNLNSAAVFFTAKLANGQLHTFGSNNYSRVRHEGAVVTLEWLQDSATDASGHNSMRYHYQAAGAGEVVLSRITYTGDVNTDGNREVRFSYQSRPDRRSGYLAGGHWQQTVRLNSISTFYQGNLLHQYTLGYQQSAGSQRSLLSQVSECAMAANGLACMAPTLFQWSDTHQGFAVEKLAFTTGHGGAVMPPRQPQIAPVLPRGDINGDGSRDWPGYFTDAEGRVRSSHNFELSNCWLAAYELQWRCHEGDFNRDGRTDAFRVDGEGRLSLGYTEGAADIPSVRWVSTQIILPIKTYIDELPGSRIESISDYNGDGWPDIVVFHYHPTQPEYRLYLHTGNPNVPYPATGQVIYTPDTFGVGVARQLVTTLQFIGDVNGDSLPDFIESTSWSGHVRKVLPQPLPQYVHYARQQANGQVSFDVQPLPFANDSTSLNRFSFFMDVNGDGLPDWIGWQSSSSGLNYALNTGKGFTVVRSAIGQTGIGAQWYATFIGNNNMEVENIYFPKYQAGLMVMDINHDGIPELLVPGQRLVTGCVDRRDWQYPYNGLNRTLCGDELYQPYKPSSDMGLATSPGPSEWDESIYAYDALMFEVDDDGQLYLTRNNQTGIEGRANQSAVVDAFGRALSDMVFVYGSHVGAGGNTFRDTGSYGTDYGVYISRNLGAGDTNGMDLLQSVTNGFGDSSYWQYLPLSTGLNTVAGYPFYLTDHGYVNDQHFHFASSMYAVAEFAQSNGVGGFNSQRFAYRGAVYNSAGRGFAGFRSVIEEDITHGLITHSDYLQKLPFTGLLQSQLQFKTAEYPNYTYHTVIGWVPPFSYSRAGEELQIAGGENAISQQLFDWQINSSHKQYHGGTQCVTSVEPRTGVTDWQCPAGNNHRYLSYLAKHTAIQRDLHSKQQLVADHKDVASVDQWGNITADIRTFQDQYGTLVTHTTSVYNPDETAWWLNKLTSSTVTRESIGNRASTDPYDRSDLDAQHWVSTQITAYHASRQPERVVIQNSDNARSKEQLISYNLYGLPLTQTEKAVLMGLNGSWASTAVSRSMAIGYGDTTASSSGYFPYTVTNAAGHVQTIKTDPATGQVQSVTDANGIARTFSYDAIGRETERHDAGKSAQYTWYDSVQADSNAPQYSLWKTVSIQAGMPTQSRYFDSLGRLLRQAVKGLNGEWINQDTQYNARGLVVAQSVPYKAGSPISWQQFSDFDELGRMGQSVKHDGQLVTTYHYDGYTTDINANGLQMQRSYNGLKQLMETVDAKGGITRYSYNAQGLPIVLRDASDNKVYARYNSLGMKSWVSDPNQGVSAYQYNGFGEVEEEQDANGVAIRYDYDVLGRVTARNSYTGSTLKDSAAFVYDTVKKGLVSSESANGTARHFGYDNYGRVTSNTVQLDGKSFSQQYYYHGQSGQLKGLGYPNGLTVQYGYSDSGYLQEVSNAASGYVYRTINSQDAYGNMLDISLGNGVYYNNQYDSATGWVQSLTAWRGGTRVHDVEYQQYDVFGNIRQVQNHVTGATESYDYDELHRLTQSTYSNMGYTVPISYSYDAVGNLQQKSDYANTYHYGNAQKSLGGNAGANAVRQVVKLNNNTVNFSYDNQGNLTRGDGLIISYNSFKQPTQIARGGNTFSFTYGANLERLKETRNGIVTYEIDKVYEEESNGNWRLYLSDIAIIEYDNSNGHQLRYTHKDRLGSTLTYTDHNGQVTDRRMFDAFGKPRATDGDTLTPARLQNLSLSRNGFTDHRHLDEVELIHMNGRAYDYNLGRFLSVDPFIQSPGDSQSLNPYSYIMNNPLAGTDPTGYVGCAASKIDSVCDTTLSRYGGNGSADMAAFATSSGSASNQGNGAQTSQPAQTHQHTATTELGSQANNSNGSSEGLKARWVGEGITQTGENTSAGTIHCDAICRSQAQSRGDASYGSAAFLLGLVAIDGPAPFGDVIAGVVGLGIIVHNMSSDKPDPLISMRNAAGTGSPMPDPDDNEHDDRPPGVPTDWVKQAARKEGHVKWVDPKNPHNYVRVKRNGEVTQVRNGKALDKNGNEVRLNSPEAHGIKLKDFKFRG